MSDNPYNNPYQQPPQQPNQQPNQPNQQPNYQGGYQQPYQSPYQQPYQSPYQQGQPYQQDNQQSQGYQQGYQKSAYPQPYQSAYQQTNKTQFLSMDSGLAGLLCYMPFMAINLIASVGFLATEPKTNFFVRFHAIQSLLLSLAGAIFGVVIAIAWGFMIAIGVAMGNDAGGVLIGIMFLGIFGLAAIFGLTIFALHIVGMYKAYNNEMWEMPIVGKYARRFSQSG